jgi:hypothetical protein
MMSGFTDGRHAASPLEEWVFAAWTPEADLGVISGHRIVARTAWYWAALARAGRPLLHVVDHGFPVRADPFIVKGAALWAEHTCDAPMQQWSVCNETYAAALDDPAEALGRAYGHPTPIAFDLEWYATDEATALVDDRPGVEGYEQPGVVHGRIDVQGEPPVELTELPARRWHRWSDDPHPGSLAPLPLAEVVAHTGVRAPFVFPDGTALDLVVTADGFRSRRGSSPSRPERAPGRDGGAG